MGSKKLISIVVPVYKSAQSLQDIVERVKGLAENSKKWNFEIIFVNDSPGYKPTCTRLSQIFQAYPEIVRVINLRKNIGQQRAVLIGLKRVRGEYTITMDDDLQHPVSELPVMITALEEDTETDVFLGIPGYENKKHSLFRNVGSWVISKIDDLILERPKGVVKSSFRIFRSELIPNILETYSASPAVSNLIMQVTHNIKNVQVKHSSRKYGDSNYSFNQLLKLTFNNIVYNSSLPLAFIGYVGIFSFFGSLIFILITIFRKLVYGIGVPGYASQVVLISFFGGLTLLGLGIIGEYLVRIVQELNKPDLENFIRDER